MKKTTVYLVRHGDVHNPDQILYGRIPGFRLSEKGREQAKKLGNFLSTKPIMAIYASPLDRTQETARIIASFFDNMPVQPDERLIEVGSPALEGKSLEELKPLQFDFYKEEYIAAGGETLTDIIDRMTSFFDEHVKKHTGEEIVVVSHGDPIMITRAKHKKEPLVLETIRQEFYVDTARGISMEFEKESITVTDLMF